MRRRTFLKAASGGLVVLIGGAAAVWTQTPVIPLRPEPDADAALSWIAFRNGRYVLTLPRAEMGQNIATALKQVACAELGASWDQVDVELHDTRGSRVKGTVGSESVMRFAVPVAQACATLRDAIAAGEVVGKLVARLRPVSELLAFNRAAEPAGPVPEIVQGREIVTGMPLFAADVMMPGMLYGKVLRAPAAAEYPSFPARWNLAAAKRIRGFAAIVEDAGPPIGQSRGLGILSRTPGALSLIEEALDVEWKVDAPSLSVAPGDMMDVDAALARGDVSRAVVDGAPVGGAWDVDLRIDVPLAAHGPIEPRAAVARWTDRTLHVHTGTQDAFYIRDYLAHAFSLPQENVVVQSGRIGGAFGGKTICTVEAEAAALSRAAKAPVKIQWTRAQEFGWGFHRPPSSHRIRARLSNGKISDWDHAQMSSHILFTSAVLPAWMQAGTDLFAGDGGVARGMSPPYAIDRVRCAYGLVRLPVHTGPWRGLGAGPNCLVVESAIDEAAVKANADPVAFRLKHIRDERLATVLRRVAEISQWSTPPSASDNLRTGRGVACGIYKDTSYAAAVADVQVDADGAVRVTRMWCVHDCGLVINPDQVRAQCEGNLAWSIGLVLSDGLTFEEGRVTAATFADAPIPRPSDIPPLVVDLITGNSPPAGAGETAMVAGPGAIANAIRAATGVRPQRFPVNADDFKA